MLRAFSPHLSTPTNPPMLPVPTLMVNYTQQLPRLPPEVWSIILEYSISLPIFFDNGWEGGLITPFDVVAHARSSTELFEHSIQVKKSVPLVCHDWYSLSRGSLYRHLVFHQFNQLEKMVDMLERSELEVVQGKRSSETSGRRASDRVPLGWHVTHVKFLLAISSNEDSRSNRAAITNRIHRLVASCPRLEILLDGIAYARDLSPMDDPTLFDTPHIPGTFSHPLPRMATWRSKPQLPHTPEFHEKHPTPPMCDSPWFPRSRGDHLRHLRNDRPSQSHLPRHVHCLE